MQHLFHSFIDTKPLDVVSDFKGIASTVRIRSRLRWNTLCTNFGVLMSLGWSNGLQFRDGMVGWGREYVYTRIT